MTVLFGKLYFEESDTSEENRCCSLYTGAPPEAIDLYNHTSCDSSDSSESEDNTIPECDSASCSDNESE